MSYIFLKAPFLNLDPVRTWCIASDRENGRLISYVLQSTFYCSSNSNCFFLIAVKCMLTYVNVWSSVMPYSFLHNYQQNDPFHAVGHSCLSAISSIKGFDQLLDLIASALRHINNFNHEQTHDQLNISSQDVCKSIIIPFEPLPCL